MGKRHIILTMIITGLLTVILCALNNGKKVESVASVSDSQRVEDDYCLSQEYSEDAGDDDEVVQIDLPESLSTIIEGASWSGEHFCTAGDRTFYLAEDEYKLTSVLCTSNQVLVEDPSLDYVHLGEEERPYLITVGEKSVMVDFADPKSVIRLMALNRGTLSGFKRKQWRNVAEFSDKVMCPLEIDVPTSSVAGSRHISRWIANYAIARKCGFAQVAVSPPTYFTNEWRNNSTYKAGYDDWDAVNEYLTEHYLDYIVREYGKNDEEYPTGVYSCLSLRARYFTSHYVTYQMTEREYGAGAHGYSDVELVSYDHVNHQEIGWKYVFKPGSEEQVLKLLAKIAETDEQFVYYDAADFWKGVQFLDDENKPDGKILLPQPALTPAGVSVSFQPYDIVGYSAGCFHLMVPYNLLKPYLTDRAKWCIGMK